MLAMEFVISFYASYIYFNEISEKTIKHFNGITKIHIILRPKDEFPSNSVNIFQSRKYFMFYRNMKIKEKIHKI